MALGRVRAFTKPVEQRAGQPVTRLCYAIHPFLI